MKKIILITFIILLTACSPNVAPEVTPTLPYSDYRQLEVSNTFKKAYQEAKETKAAWLQNPQEVALRAAGYPIDGQKPQKTVIAELGTRKGVFIFTSGNLSDDSVKQHEKIVEVKAVNEIENEEVWEVVYVGARFMCRRGSNTTQWQKELCP